MNPSAWNLRIVIALVAAVATSISLYLGLFQWGVFPTVWDPVFGDGTKNVLTSPLSHKFTSWIGIPDAILGVLAYFADIFFALVGSKDRWKEHPWLVLLFGISIIPVGCVSITLVLLQGLVVKSWCFLCLIAALISLILIFLSYGEVAASCRYLREVSRITNRKTAWRAAWGISCPESEEAARRALST